MDMSGYLSRIFTALHRQLFQIIIWYNRKKLRKLQKFIEFDDVVVTYPSEYDFILFQELESVF